MEFEQILEFSRSAGLIWFIALFLAACGWTWWHWRKGEFDHASRIPLAEDEE